MLMDPCGGYPSDQGGVREHRCEPTRSGGTEPAMYPTPEMVQASAGRDGAVRPLSIPRNPRRAVRAGFWTRSAVSCEVGVQSLPPTVVTRPEGSGWLGGSARQRFRIWIPLFVYTSQ